MNTTLHVTVHFGEGIGEGVQGPVLMALEKHLRVLTDLDCRVYKERLGDDSKLRLKMTPSERERL